MLLNRPCGACGELVDATEGCRHWNPKSATGKKVQTGKRKARHPYDPTVLAFATRMLQRPGIDTLASDTVE